MGIKDMELTVTNVAAAIVLALVTIQGFGLLFANSVGANIKLGPIFVVLPIGIASLISLAVVKKMAKDYPVTRGDIFAIVIVWIFTLLIMLFLDDIVPSIFENSVAQTQALLNIG